MNENFKPMQAGDLISATRHMNPLMQTLGGLARSRPSPYSGGKHNQHSVTDGEPIPFYITNVQLVDWKYKIGASAHGTDIYKVWERYYKFPENDSEQGEWFPNKGGRNAWDENDLIGSGPPVGEGGTGQAYRQFYLDARECLGRWHDFDDRLFFHSNIWGRIPQKTTAWWHTQRGAFVPCGMPLNSWIGRPVYNVGNNSIGDYVLFRMTENGFTPLFENGERASRLAYNQSGITHTQYYLYQIDQFNQSTFLSSFPYAVAPCPVQSADCFGCSDNPAPNAFNVGLTGSASAGEYPLGCSSEGCNLLWFGTTGGGSNGYVVGRIVPIDINVGVCEFRSDFVTQSSCNGIALFPRIRVIIENVGLGGGQRATRITVELTIRLAIIPSTIYSMGVYQKTFDEVIDCSSLSGEQIPHYPSYDNLWFCAGYENIDVFLTSV